MTEKISNILHSCQAFGWIEISLIYKTCGGLSFNIFNLTTLGLALFLFLCLSLLVIQNSKKQFQFLCM